MSKKRAAPRVLLVSVLETSDKHRIAKELASLRKEYQVDFLGRDSFPGRGAGRLLRMAWWLVRNIRNYDALHFHEVFSLILLPCLPFRRKQARIVYEEREFKLLELQHSVPFRAKAWILFSYKGLRPVMRWLADGTVAISDEMSRTSFEGKAVVVKNYPDTEWMAAQEPNNKLDRRFTYLVNHGVFIREKGVLRYPELLSRAGVDDMKLLLIGDLDEHDLSAELMAKAEEFAVADRIIRTGRLPYADTISYLKNDVRMIGLLVSDDVGQMSRSVFVKAYEFLALGIPMVGSKHVADFVENIVKNGAGLAADASDPASEAEAIRQVHENYDEFRAACLRLRDRFTWSTQAANLLEMYRGSDVRATVR